LDDKALLLDIAIALRAVVDLQINEIKATSEIAKKLESDYPNLYSEVQAARNTTVVPEVQSVRLLREKIQSIIDLLSKTQDQSKAK
jgi:hypothetical protein